VAIPEVTDTDELVSLNSKIFVKPFKFVVPVFVNPVYDVVPFIKLFKQMLKLRK
jgi:hypothetical protein